MACVSCSSLNSGLTAIAATRDLSRSSRTLCWDAAGANREAHVAPGMELGGGPVRRASINWVSDAAGVEARTTTGIFRRSCYRSHCQPRRLDRQYAAGRNAHVAFPDDGSPSHGARLSPSRWYRAARCSCRPGKRSSRKRLPSVTRRRLRRACPIFPRFEPHYDLANGGTRCWFHQALVESYAASHSQATRACGASGPPKRNIWDGDSQQRPLTQTPVRRSWAKADIN